KQYKVGTSNATWTNYTTTFAITSNTVLANNWQNADGTVTIYAKGKDSAGNEVTVQKKVLSLDLDKPSSPVITSNAGYATLTEYGTKIDATTTITYDTRTDIDNYYSIDNGTTWRTYTGQFEMTNGVIIAKSIKKSSGLTVSVSKTITMPVDALGIQAYDSNDSTYESCSGSQYKYIQIDKNLQGKNIRIKSVTQPETTGYIYFMDENKNVLLTKSLSGWLDRSNTFDETYIIPNNTKWIKFSKYSYVGGYNFNIYEIQLNNEATFNSTNGYMLLTADLTKSIRTPYQMITINYFTTSIQRLYRIGTTGNWINYEDQQIKVEQGQTIYAKGIDKDGNETRIISSYTSNVIDAITKEAMDSNDSTYTNINNKYIEVDVNMQGKSIRIKGSSNLSITFLNSEKTVISAISPYNDGIFAVPQGTKWIKGNNYNLYTIEVSNEPTFKTINGYILLHLDPTKSIREPYQSVEINYFPTSVRRLYRIGTTGEWLNYTDQPLNIINGQTIYAKGIDVYGNETRIISSYTVNVTDAISKEIIDNNESTYAVCSNTQNRYMQIDKSLQGKNIRIKSVTQRETIGYIYFMDANKNILLTKSLSLWLDRSNTFDEIYTIPNGTLWIAFSKYSYVGGYNFNIYEIQVSN
ncbi:MAG: hypothetical protein K0R72_1078, partial [Clostridia bacterium]|nr:hypothetical protein [Clostridia bacterium]